MFHLVTQISVSLVLPRPHSVSYRWGGTTGTVPEVSPNLFYVVRSPAFPLDVCLPGSPGPRSAGLGGGGGLERVSEDLIPEVSLS